MSGGKRARKYLVECYWPGVDREKVASAKLEVPAVQAARSGSGRRARFLGAILVPTDETVFCLFEGRKADVRAVCEQAGVPFERVLETLWIAGEDGSKEE